jgi:Mn2+/Fe2+ NRAMP family transporter
MCARIALVTGRGLATNIKHHYSRRTLHVVILLLFLANTFNIGADLGAMAQAVRLIVPVNAMLVMIIVGFIIIVSEIFLSYQKYAKYLKWVTIALLTYVATIFFVRLPLGEILSGTFIPTISFSKDTLLIITAVLGTTISPYLFFWQTSQEVEEQILEGKVTVASRHGTSDREVTEMRRDVWTGMFFSNLVMFCIIAVCGATLYANGITTIDSAAQAANALRPFAGNAAYILFALGIIGTGFLAIPVLAGSTSYAVAESFGWKEGLYRKWFQARAFYGAIVVSIGCGLLLNFFNIDPIKTLIYSAVLNGLIAPVIIYYIVHLSSNGRIMGEFKNRTWYTVVGYAAFLVMVVAGLATIVSFFF